MAKLPNVSGREAISAFGKIGFYENRQSSSHVVLKKDGHRYNLSIPVHSNEDLKKGTLRQLIRSAGITVEKFCELL